MRFFLIFILFQQVLYGQNFKWAIGEGSEVLGGDFGIANVTDANGNIYTVGCFRDTVDFDPGVGVYNLITHGGQDIFIQKLDSNGSFVWAKGFGGIGGDIAQDMTMDDFGNVYITGIYSYTADFDPGPSTYNLTSPGGFDAYLAKINSAGNLVWARNISGTGYEYGQAVCTDNFNNVYLTGIFNDVVDFDPGTGVYNLSTPGNYEVFLEKFNSSGNMLWVKQFTGNSDGNVTTVSCDLSGNIYLGGNFYGTIDLDPGTGTQNHSSNGVQDMFIVKLNSAGNYLWGKTFGSTGSDLAISLCTDNTASIFATGVFMNTVDFDSGTGVQNLVSNGSSDAFILKLTSAGNLVWAKSIGGPFQDEGFSIISSSTGNIYLSGSFEGTADLCPGAWVYNCTSNGAEDGYVLKMNSSGDYQWAATFGGPEYDAAFGMAIDDWENIIITGTFNEICDFDPGWDVYNLISNGEGDIFIQKMGSELFTGIAEPEGYLELQIYPNPSNGSIHFTWDNSYQTPEISIYNMQGQIVFSKFLLRQQESINVGGLSAGIYNVVFRSGEKMTNKKLIVQRE